MGDAYPDVAKAMPTGVDLIFGSGISIGAVAAILLNIVFFHTGSPRAAAWPAAARSPSTRSTR